MRLAERGAFGMYFSTIEKRMKKTNYYGRKKAGITKSISEKGKLW